MRIAGLRRLSLLDYPEKLCATVFTPGCDFRCPFCHNAALVRGQGTGDGETEISVEDFFAFLERRRGVLDGVCVTGGEPLLQPDLASFLRRVKAMGFLVKLDTNGSSPDKLAAILDAGLVDYVAMDVKNELPRYAETVGVADFDTSRVERSVRLLREGRVPYEFRTTLVREFHDAKAVAEIGRWLDGAPVYSLQAFSDEGDLLQGGLHGFAGEEMYQFAALVQKNFGKINVRGV